MRRRTNRPSRAGRVDRVTPIYPIRTVAQMTDLSPQRIRAWETDYGLIRPHRTGGGHRLFSQEDVERLLWIKRMVQERGLSLQGVKRLLEDTAGRRGR
ncbi:MAG: MerR family transcriptional regulator [Armatimonadota bacterium]|nr:MerR family transcriptional regulator [Armatimonadota bacterium]MDR5676825.1 MerR family transcriptional regulator [Armatimonadota bacterium]MDR5688531.1 MerR family transcriptional regulator [Armatimonadota bacterium]MDR7387411.1 MerR family transcriptional regulator [Armatimonadota bacterium]MDR7390206.1 MerR family transcriptional regulator [Armatimonadota bacterium]